LWWQLALAAVLGGLVSAAAVSISTGADRAYSALAVAHDLSVTVATGEQVDSANHSVIVRLTLIASDPAGVLLRSPRPGGAFHWQRLAPGLGPQSISRPNAPSQPVAVGDAGGAIVEFSATVDCANSQAPSTIEVLAERAGLPVLEEIPLAGLPSTQGQPDVGGALRNAACD
jgi:hypothetical protein